MIAGRHGNNRAADGTSTDDRRSLRRALHVLTLAALLGAGPAFLPAPVHAQDTAPGAETGENEPVQLTANELVYDEDTDVITAQGAVELIQGDRVLLADKVIYDRTAEMVVAIGNVVLLEPTGEVFFGDFVDLNEDLGEGFVDGVSGVLAENVRFIAQTGERTDGGRFMRMERAVYSPCALCENEPDKPPLWQLRARTVTHDRETKDITYRDAFLELGGVPVAYTPFLRHPDPTVERRSGFLAPRVGFATDLGFEVRPRYYWSISPDFDATFGAGFFSEQLPVVSGEVRKRFQNAEVSASGSFTRSDRFIISDEPQRAEGKSFRGHLFADGRIDLSDRWRGGLEFRRTTDDSYLQQYSFPFRDVLDSRLFAEGFNGDDYALIEAYDFQDLRPNFPEELPTVLPLAQYEFLTDPGDLLGGRGRIESSLVGLARSDGPDMTRLGVELEWTRDFLLDAGLLTTVEARVRGDGYYLNDQDPRFFNDPEEEERFEGRFFPQLHIVSRYPLARAIGSSRIVVEPILAATTAPRTLGGDDIPNEDSLDIELDAGSLFSANRFAGVDRQEGGHRVTYGGRVSLFAPNGFAGRVFAGQSYRFSEGLDFPDGTGLENQQSDLVGDVQVDLPTAPNLNLQYRFRIGTEDFEQRLHDINVAGGIPEFNANVGYLFVDEIEGSAVTTTRNELRASVASNFGTRYYNFSGFTTRRMGSDAQFLSFGGAMTYVDECFTFELVGTRDLTVDDREGGGLPGVSVFARVVFTTLGEFQTNNLVNSLDNFNRSDDG